MPKPRVFLDSSVIIAALLSSRGASYYLLSQRSEILDFRINEYVFEEVRRSLDIKFSGQPALISHLYLVVGRASSDMNTNPAAAEVRAAETVISKKDAPILASALTHSEYLLTLDNEFFNTPVIAAARDKSLTIVKPGELIRLFDT